MKRLYDDWFQEFCYSFKCDNIELLLVDIDNDCYCYEVKSIVLEGYRFSTGGYIWICGTNKVDLVRLINCIDTICVYEHTPNDIFFNCDFKDETGKRFSYQFGFSVFPSGDFFCCISDNLFLKKIKRILGGK